MDSSQIRRNIKRLRNAKGLTQKEMAKALFMDERTYSNFERGIKKSIDVKLLFAISDILQMDICNLIINPAKEKEVLAEERFQNILNEINNLKALFLSELKEIKKELGIEKTA
ncbi:helix-turn-helix transcriptional regulator [Taibaiella lutea]|uniref:Helix-turn-helix transcriptional regulator n=1 Tax=Taibaiella lutea TaxID=2608001 RepID=A0A5M6CMW4_9BACT|nr:helix-turn-helix transcriptional regulator [Taibaiella lutea]KAA5534635.1 helix-turn-helix transcriptional regulator [Taibaiella lutea]